MRVQFAYVSKHLPMMAQSQILLRMQSHEIWKTHADSISMAQYDNIMITKW